MDILGRCIVVDKHTHNTQTIVGYVLPTCLRMNGIVCLEIAVRVAVNGQIVQLGQSWGAGGHDGIAVYMFTT